MDINKLWVKIFSKWRIMLVIFIPILMLYTLNSMLTLKSVSVYKGKVDLSGINLSHNKLVALDGQWEFYWNKLLMPEDFNSEQTQQMDSFIKVPGVWASNAGTEYTRQGRATYRLSLEYPASLKDPALRIQNVANSYKLYVNGHLTAKAGRALDNQADIVNGDKIIIIDLPKDTQKIDLIFQVANLNYATGGLRIAPVFGSKQALEQQRMMMLSLQMFFIGGAFIFGVYYLLLFLLQTKNKTALLFAIFCLITAFRSMIWGEVPFLILFPHASLDLRLYINYLTGYNYVAIVILFVHSLYSLEYKKTITGIILLPSLVFDGLLLTTSPQFVAFYTNYLYIFLLLQMLYVMGVLMKSVLRKRDNAVFMFIAICILIWTMNADILNYLVLGDIHLTSVFLLGNFAVIMAMSYVQSIKQAMNYKNLILYNERLLEADKLKDKIMATEMSFLQAQIKPHFLYNALNAIANVCEKDGKQAGKLIIDLAVYLRGSLEFNNLDKMATIKKELEFVDTYFHIEQARFGQKIQLKKEIEISLDVRIPVLILQPLVENAVRHGISKKPDGGTVTVRMIQKDKDIYIEIEDDGIGIRQEKLAGILKETGLDHQVGLLNTHSRLLKLYGRGLEISSDERHTCVKLWITEVV